MKHNNIQYSKDLEWLVDFVESVRTIVPLQKLKSIKSYKVKKGLTEQSYGSVIKDNDIYSINLRVYTYSHNFKQYKPETIAIVLDTLAHELSHVKQSNKDFAKHDYKHFKIQALILRRFSDILKKLNIDDTSKGFNNL